ncbi:uncharacterized protein BCR38DRAFT_415028 [Pseudomassariella vexata]|uniref:Uncharacterized protein n=1 Tax=Pseudomassariella vexata TaxID=1141098 RepID=A0A1Y2D7W8_9PEZI|nr:uncharacterized protein BCR38DRAFT_415028 [Pseudomassariella vexata]ORY55307.1 hypothetical protein BCR38DRAFT_415028 [Pseudomassariella vexata]
MSSTRQGNNWGSSHGTKPQRHPPQPNDGNHCAAQEGTGWSQDISWQSGYVDGPPYGHPPQFENNVSYISRGFAEQPSFGHSQHLVGRNLGRQCASDGSDHGQPSCDPLSVEVAAQTEFQSEADIFGASRHFGMPAQTPTTQPACAYEAVLDANMSQYRLTNKSTAGISPTLLDDTAPAGDMSFYPWSSFMGPDHVTTASGGSADWGLGRTDSPGIIDLDVVYHPSVVEAPSTAYGPESYIAGVEAQRYQTGCSDSSHESTTLSTIPLVAIMNSTARNPTAESRPRLREKTFYGGTMTPTVPGRHLGRWMSGRSQERDTAIPHRILMVYDVVVVVSVCQPTPSFGTSLLVQPPAIDPADEGNVNDAIADNDVLGFPANPQTQEFVLDHDLNHGISRISLNLAPRLGIDVLFGRVHPSVF